MLQAETKITTLIVDSMVTRLNELAKHVSVLFIYCLYTVNLFSEVYYSRCSMGST